MAGSLSGRWAALSLCLALAGCAALPGGRRQRQEGRPVAVPLGEPVPLLLTPGDVLKLAVHGTGVGAALGENAAQGGGGGGGGGGCPTCRAGRKQTRLLAELQGHAADEARNETAALALTLYYRLAEARAQLGLLGEAMAPLDLLVAQADELKRRGLPVPEEATTARQQRGKAQSERVKMALLRERLNEQLTHRVGKAACLPPGAAAKITTIEVFPVTVVALDEREALEVGFKLRPDLNLLRTALCNLDASTLPVIQQVLAGANSLLGARAKRCLPALECLPRFCPSLAAGEIDKVRKQLLALLDDRKRQAGSEIRQAVRAVQAEQELIRLAREREATARGRLEEVEAKARQKMGKPSDVPLAQRDLIQARGDVLHEVIEWEIAQVNLRKAQGLLVRDAVQLATEAAGCAAMR